MWKTEFSAIMAREFDRMRSTNHRTSLRSFARKLGVAHSTVSAIIKGNPNWNMSTALAERVLLRTQCDARDYRRVLALMGRVDMPTRKTLTDRNSVMLLDWIYLPVLLSFDLDEESRKPASIARRLAVPEERVREAIERLTAEGLLKLEEGVLRRTEEHWISSDNIASETVRAHHFENLKTSTRALAEIPMERRDFTALTFVGNRAQLDLIRQEIRVLYEKAQAIMKSSRTEGDEVFRLSVNLFPMDFSPPAPQEKHE